MKKKKKQQLGLRASAPPSVACFRPAPDLGAAPADAPGACASFSFFSFVALTPPSTGTDCPPFYYCLHNGTCSSSSSKPSVFTSAIRFDPSTCAAPCGDFLL